MNDLINRQQAIDAINCDITVTGRQNAELVAATIGTFADRIKALPSAQPKLIEQDAYERGFEQGRTQGKIDADLQQKRKTGYWTLYDKRFPWLHDYKCSQCGKRLSFSGLSGEAKFCPYCGAKMEGILNG